MGAGPVRAWHKFTLHTSSRCGDEHLNRLLNDLSGWWIIPVEYKILNKPSYPVLKILLGSGEEVEAEPEALMMYRGELEVETRSRGLLRLVAGRESPLANKYRALEDGVELWLAPSLPGDIAYIPLEEGCGLIVNDKAYLASHGNVEHSVVWRGLRGVFSSGGLLWLRFRGSGGVWVDAYGSLLEVEVRPGDRLTIGSIHLVAMEDTLDYEIRRLSGLKTVMSSDGFVFEVSGSGKLVLQTRKPTTWYAAKAEG